jgi:hypothetical protein
MAGEIPSTRTDTLLIPNPESWSITVPFNVCVRITFCEKELAAINKATIVNSRFMLV